MLDNVAITGVQDVSGNPVNVRDLKDDVELIRDVAEMEHIGKPLAGGEGL